MCGGSCGVPFMTLSSKAAVINGIVQIVAGAFAFAFGIGLSLFGSRWTVLTYTCPGAWCGVLFVAGGIVMLIAGCKRSFCCTIGALVLAVFNVIFSLTFFVYVILEFTDKRVYRCWPWWWEDLPLEDCSNEIYQIAIFMLSASILAAFAELFAVIWAIVITSQAFCHGGCIGGAKTSAPEVHRNIHAESKCLRSNWICQLVSAIISIVTTCIVIVIYNYGITNYRVYFLQELAPALWSAPVYMLTPYCGFRAWKFGENSSLIIFLVLNLIQVPLCVWEGRCSLEAIYFAFESIRRGHPIYDTSETVVTILHGVVMFSAGCHIIVSVWGTIAASIAVAKDGACNCCCSRPNCAECGCCGCCINEDEEGDQVLYVKSPASDDDVQTGSCTMDNANLNSMIEAKEANYLDENISI